MLRHVDLVSGIGGFALGFQWAKLSKPVLFCDIEPFCRKVLAKHWPDVPIAEDVRELADDPIRYVPECDIITAGYPCQNFSISGNRLGEKDNRHIWPEIFSIIQARRPTWAVFENVRGHISMGLDTVLSDLGRISYSATPFVIPACATDAPHFRFRLFIVARDMANFDSTGRQEQWWPQPTQEETEALERRSRWATEPRILRVAHGIPNRVDRIASLGNAIVPQIAQRIGETIKRCS